MLRAVVDNSVLVSGIISYRGAPHRVLLAAFRGHFRTVTSGVLIDEFERVTSRPALMVYPQVASHRDKVIGFLRFHSVGTLPGMSKRVIAADASDDHVLECALAGHADYIVSGDRHLLALKEYQGIRIVTPREFLRVLQGAR